MGGQCENEAQAMSCWNLAYLVLWEIHIIKSCILIVTTHKVSSFFYVTPEGHNVNLSAQKPTTFYVQWCTIILRPNIGLCRRCWNLLMYTAMIYWYSREGSSWKTIVPLRTLSWHCKEGQLNLPLLPGPLGKHLR